MPYIITLCKWSLFCILSLLTVCYIVLVSVLDNHVSVEQLISIRNLKELQYTNYMCFEMLKVFKKAHAAFDEGRGIERGKGREFAISSDGIFLTYML